MRYRYFIALLFTLGSLHAQLQSVNLRNNGTDDHHTRVSLLADVQHVRPGAPFTIGVVMSMEKGWHTYWKNAGEAGLPTRIAWTLPDGFSAGDIQWPLPHKYLESGDILTYGYEHENMLLVQISPPTHLREGSRVTLEAKVNWLECERLCVPGDADVSIELPVSSAEAVPANSELFEKYRAQVPRPFGKTEEVSFAAETRDGKVIITLNAGNGGSFVTEENKRPDFYPAPLSDLTIGRTAVRAGQSTATLQVPFAAPDKVSESLTLRGVLVYQLAGGVRQANTIEVQLAKEFVASLPADLPSEQASSGSILDQPFTTTDAASGEQPIYYYLLFAVVGGLLLNIMPCVLPVISLKIFGLMKMAGDHPKQVRKLGWFFSLGILASFLTLAVVIIVLKSAGEQVGWGFQFQEPLFVIAMCAIVFAFGLSLFGVFEIMVPGFALAGMSSAVEKVDQKRTGFLAPFAEGVFATILATPCTAPFLGSALGFAFSQPTSIILLIFTAIAFGMALPYLLLTSRPAWMKFLPKPGEWMVTAKQFMGFLMMATALWLLYILGKQLGMEAVIWTSAFLLVVGIACWMIGRFATLTASRTKSVLTWVMASVLLVAGYKFFVGDVLHARDVLANPTTGTSTESERIVWQPFTIESLEAHLKENKPVFIDFTAEWCLTCKVNEKTVLADRQVVEKLKQNNIITMKADWTNRNETITRLLQKFGRSGVPLYVLFPAGKPTEPIILPEVITPGIVIEAVERAG